jgi:hypothetical protein
VQKTAVFGGPSGEIEVKNGHFLAKKAGRKAIFCVPEWKLAGTE